MGVEVGVAGAGVPVMELGGDDAKGVDLGLPPVPGPGERGVRLEPGEASATAASWASKICCWTGSDAKPHRRATDFTGVNVRSYPATASRRETPASPRSASSTGSTAARPVCRAKPAVDGLCRAASFSASVNGRPTARSRSW